MKVPQPADIQAPVTHEAGTTGHHVTAAFVTDLDTPTTYELYAHGSDIGIRGLGAAPSQAFGAVALALTSAIADPRTVRARRLVDIQCQASNLESLLYEWINALIYEMATRRMLFSRYRIAISGTHLVAEAWGERLDMERHQPAVEIKGATYTDLKVNETSAGTWMAQCIVDV